MVAHWLGLDTKLLGSEKIILLVEITTTSRNWHE